MSIPGSKAQQSISISTRRWPTSTSIFTTVSWSPCSALRLRQDHLAADHRRAGAGRQWQRHHPRRGCLGSPCARAQRWLRVPALRPVSPMTVFENVAFGLRVKPRSERPDEGGHPHPGQRAAGSGAAQPVAARYPTQLSGGQRQRVALAGLAVQPKVLLLDRAFGALDAQGAQELRRWLRELHDELHVTSLFVTHDQEEALEVADRVVLMNAGKVEQIGTPAEVHDQPASAFVHSFLGSVNLFRGRVAGQGPAR